jgi:outer membrane protease
MPYSHIMSNIGKITLFVIFIAVFLSPVFAEEKQSGFGFSIVPSFGIINGRANEIVYKNSHSDMFESELQWNMETLFYAGLGADFGPLDIFARHGFVGNFSLKMGIPQKTGIIEDRDWLYENPEALTNYSRHDNFSERAIMADLSLGYSFPLLNFIALGLNLDFSYKHFYWNARDGYYQYLNSDSSGKILPGQTWNDGIPKVNVTGKVLEYTQNWLIFSPGVFIKLRLGDLFSLNGNFFCSPFIYCADRDDHLLINKTFLDYLYYGQYIKGSGGITFSPLDYLDLTLFLSYSSITGSRGDTYIYSVKYSGIAGGEYSALEIGLSVRLRFFGR